MKKSWDITGLERKRAKHFEISGQFLTMISSGSISKVSSISIYMILVSHKIMERFWNGKL